MRRRRASGRVSSSRHDRCSPCPPLPPPNPASRSRSAATSSSSGSHRPKKMNAFDVGHAEGASRPPTRPWRRTTTRRCAVVFAHGDHFTARARPRERRADGAGRDSALRRGGRRCVGGAREGANEARRGRGARPLPHARHRAVPWRRTWSSRRRTRASRRSRSSEASSRSDGATFRFVQVAGWGNAMRVAPHGGRVRRGRGASGSGSCRRSLAPGAQLARAIEIGETIAAQAPLGVRATIRVRAAVRSSRRRRPRALIPGDPAADGDRRRARGSGCPFWNAGAAKFEGK